MIWLVGFGRFWYGFIVGDDWRLAVGVSASVAATVLIAHTARTAWWLMPVAVICTLTISIRRAAKVAAPAVAVRSSHRRPGSK
jgi:hypothetical protein